MRRPPGAHFAPGGRCIWIGPKSGMGTPERSSCRRSGSPAARSGAIRAELAIAGRLFRVIFAAKRGQALDQEIEQAAPFVGRGGERVAHHAMLHLAPPLRK